MTIQCCNCNKVRSGDHWEPVHGLLKNEVSHTYCPTCFAEAMDELRAEEATRRARNNRQWLPGRLAC